jgi:hypothetical protein
MPAPLSSKVQQNNNRGKSGRKADGKADEGFHFFFARFF